MIRPALPPLQVVFALCAWAWAAVASGQMHWRPDFPVDTAKFDQAVQVFEDSVLASWMQSIHDLPTAEVVTEGRPVAGRSLEKVDRLSPEALDQQPEATRIAALAALPGVDVQNAGGGMLRPVVRGLSGLRVMTLFQDAIIESQAWGEQHGIFLAEEGIEKVEVIRGAGALLYGPEAMGGALRFVPLTGGSEIGRTTRFSLTGHSNTGGFQASGMTRKRSESAYHSFIGGLNRYGALMTPDGQEVIGTAYGQFYAQGRFGYFLPWGSVDGAYSSAYNTASIPGVGGLAQSGDHLVTTTAHIQGQRWTHHPGISYQLNHRIEAPETEEHLAEGLPVDTTFDQNLRTLRLSYRADRHVGPSGFRWAWGGQAATKTNTSDLAEGLVSMLPSAAEQSLGGWAMGGRSTDRWSADFVVRTDHRILEAEGETGRTFTGVSGAAGLEWFFGSRGLVGLRASQVSRPPSMGELWSRGVHNSTSREEWGRSDLALEINRGLELHGEWLSDKFNVQLSAYHNNYQDYITWEVEGINADGLPIYRRAAVDAKIRGLEMSSILEGENGWGVMLAGSLLEGQTQSGNTLPLFPPSNARLTLQKSGQPKGLLKDWQGSAVVTASREAVLLGAGISTRWGEHLDFGITGSNLLNTSYTTVLSTLTNLGLPQAGRNIRVQLRWTL